MPYTAWENRAQVKRNSLRSAIPRGWRLEPETIQAADNVLNVTQFPNRFLSAAEIRITESSALEILANIRASVWTSRAVTEAFCHRAAIAHQLVNCLTEILFDNALREASQLDQYRLRTGELKGPLHGLPISFMDRYRIAGAETGAGYIGWLGRKEEPQNESVLVKQIRALGAVPFCKTNMPMSMLLGDTSNNITGHTLNPFVRSLSSGGAAGGEAVLQAMRGSPFGWGIETAGSARIPAAFNDVYALRVSTGRLPAYGIASTIQGLPVCGTIPAPISTDLSSLASLMKCVFGSQMHRYDPSMIELPWRDDKFREVKEEPSHLAYGLMRWDGHVMPHPPVQRALDVAAQALRNQGYEVIDWNPPPHAPAARTLFEIIGSDGAQGVRAALALSGEPPVAQLREWYYQQDTGSLPSAKLWTLFEERLEYQIQYQDYWKSMQEQTSRKYPVNAVILPVAPTAAGARDDISPYYAYSAIVNFLDYSAGSFPVTFADQAIDQSRGPHRPANEEDQAVWDSYDATFFHGAPVGLQVMCGKLEEEAVLAHMGVIKTALDEWRAKK